MDKYVLFFAWRLSQKHADNADDYDFRRFIKIKSVFIRQNLCYLCAKKIETVPCEEAIPSSL